MLSLFAAGELVWMTLKGPFQLEKFCDSMFLIVEHPMKFFYSTEGRVM